jgi:hypothetical protein
MLVRAFFVVANAVTGYTTLVYVLGVMFVTAELSSLYPNGQRVPTKRNKRELLGYALLGIAADSIIDDRFVNSRVLAVALIIGGLLVMQLRNRSGQRISDQQSETSAVPPPPPGGWTADDRSSTAAASTPPRWGLSGEAVNPQIWGGQVQPPSTRDTSVLLVSVLAIGLWSNTSRFSPVRKASDQNRGSWVLRTSSGVEELSRTVLGDGSYVINASDLHPDVTEPIEIAMGSGRLELVLPDSPPFDAEVRSRTSNLSVQHRGGTEDAPVAISQTGKSVSARRTSPATQLRISVTADDGTVCIRRRSERQLCSARASAAKTPATKTPAAKTPATTGAPPTSRIPATTQPISKGR